MKSFALRRLKALNCPLLDTIDVTGRCLTVTAISTLIDLLDNKSLCSLVCWLEDVKIRRYETESRSFLTNAENLSASLNQVNFR